MTVNGIPATCTGPDASACTFGYATSSPVVSAVAPSVVTFGAGGSPVQLTITGEPLHVVLYLKMSA